MVAFYLVARIRVVNCGLIVLCRTLTVAQCLTVNLAVTAISINSRSRVFVSSVIYAFGEEVGRFGAVVFGWRFLHVGKRTEGFATSLLILSSPFVLDIKSYTLSKVAA